MRPFLAALGLLVLCGPLPAADPVQVFVLAGQSNMVGFGEVEARADLNGGAGSLARLVEDPATAARFAHLVDGDGAWVTRDDVHIAFRGEREAHGPLAPGFGSNATRIGPELGFGHVVGEHLDEPVLLVKIAWGGKSLGADFRPPSAGGEVGPYYTALFAALRDVLDNLEQLFPGLGPTGASEGAARGYELAGFAWHQGWNDRVNQTFNDAYEQNLAHFIGDLRAELGVPDLPFVLAETGMSGREEAHPRALSLMRAQAAVAERAEFRGNVGFVATRDFFRPEDRSPNGQAYHWNHNAETYYLIGDGLGRAMVELLEAGAGD